jgi:rhodanese-related sulfurtransferase
MIESNPNLVILDVRTQAEYDSGHIQNATLIPVTELANRLGELDTEKEILVYCKAGGRSATASQILVDNGFSKVYNMLGGITAWMSAGYWIEIAHNGDLIIDGTQIFVIENCTYIQTGNIYVRDDAKLSIRNAEVTINQTNLEQFEFIAEDYATVELEDTRLASRYSMNFRFIEHSNATFNKVRLDVVGYVTFVNFNDYSKANICDFLSVGAINLYFNDYSEAYIVNSTISYIMPTGACRIKVSNSSIAILELWFPHGDVVEVHDLRSGFSDYLDLKEKVSSSQAFDVELNNTSANWWLAACYDSTTQISDSVLAVFTVDVSSSISARLEGLEPRYYESKNVGEITLNSTSVTDALRVSMHAQDADCTISNSKVRLMTGHNSRLYVVDSVIYEIHTYERNFVGSLYFDNATFPEGTLWFLFSNFYISGHISFGQPSILWYSSNVTRNYSVIAKDSFGEPSTNASLTLQSDDDVLIWNGTTDSQGEADFNLTFTDNNYTDTLRLEVIKGNLSVVENITFLGNTPLIVQLGSRTSGDINDDGTVDIYDAIMLANAYNSRPGDPNWNATADINNDGTIDIYDAIILASNYGKKA